MGSSEGFDHISICTHNLQSDKADGVANNPHFPNYNHRSFADLLRPSSLHRNIAIITVDYYCYFPVLVSSYDHITHSLKDYSSL